MIQLFQLVMEDMFKLIVLWDDFAFFGAFAVVLCSVLFLSYIIKGVKFND